MAPPTGTEVTLPKEESLTRSRSRTQTRKGRRTRSRSRSSGKSSALSASQTDNESSGTETSSVQGGGKGKKRNRNKNLYDVLQTHEGLLKQLTAEMRDLKSSNRHTDNLANSLSRTTLKSAIEQERGKERQPIGTEQLEAPRLGKTDCKEIAYNKALQAFHSSFRTSVNGESCHTVRELYSFACSTAEANSFSKKQFYQLFRSRVVANSALGAFVRESARKQTSLKKFCKGLSIYYCQTDTYISALRRYQEFTGKNLTAGEFLAQLRSVSSGLVETQPGGPRDPEADEQTLLAHMREKLFTIMPTLAETILNKERSTREPSDSYEFGELLTRYRLRIEEHLRGYRGQVNDLSVRFKLNDLGLDDTPQDKDEKATRKAKVLRLTKEQFSGLRGRCYKCSSRSPLQDENHCHSDCLLYQGKPLALQLCNKCSFGAHHPSDCLQANDCVSKLKQRSKELNLPIRLSNEVNVDLID